VGKPWPRLAKGWGCYWHVASMWHGSPVTAGPGQVRQVTGNADSGNGQRGTDPDTRAVRCGAKCDTAHCCPKLGGSTEMRYHICASTCDRLNVGCGFEFVFIHSACVMCYPADLCPHSRGPSQGRREGVPFAPHSAPVKCHQGATPLSTQHQDHMWHSHSHSKTPASIDYTALSRR
jgi:hypothetical protein